jgi:hypothetical protein
VDWHSGLAHQVDCMADPQRAVKAPGAHAQFRLKQAFGLTTVEALVG